MCVAEAADDDKLINDHCKLLRKGKDILDCLLETVVEKGATGKGKSLFIQLGCIQRQLSSIHLGDETNVYIAIPKQRLLLPTSAASIRRFEPTMAALLQLRRELSKLAMVIQQQQELLDEKRHSFGTSRSRPAPTILTHSLKKTIHLSISI